MPAPPIWIPTEHYTEDEYLHEIHLIELTTVASNEVEGDGL
jgi:hypothetical protein